MKRNHLTRRGMTLVELLVAAAMCIMGMWLLTWLYQQGLESFRQARSQADLTTQLRMFTQTITRDLTADHFERQDDKPNGGKRVSDQRLDQMTLYADPKDAKKFLVGGYTPPKRGYFRAGSYPIDKTNNVSEGTDPAFVADSSRSTNHFLQFTAILSGGSNFQQFSAEVSANSTNQYFGTAAEITYYLVPSGQMAGTTPLYDLYRCQRLVARNREDADAYDKDMKQPTGKTDASEVMVLKPNPNPMPLPTDPPKVMATLEELTFQGIGGVRLQGPTFPKNTVRVSEDKLISNVISFEVKFTGTIAMTPNPNPNPPMIPGIRQPDLTILSLPEWPTKASSGNNDYPYDTLPLGGTFDTCSTLVTDWQLATNVASSGNEGRDLKPIRITGAQIRLRIFDQKTRSTRQTTVIVDL